MALQFGDRPNNEQRRPEGLYRRAAPQVARSTIRNMRTLTLNTVAVAAVALLLAGCTSQELWRTGQQWKKQECARLKDLDERKRCEKSTATSYEQFKAESQTADKKP